MAESTSIFWKGLFAVASHAGSTEYCVSWSYKARDVNGYQLYMKTVISNSILRRSTFFGTFCLW